MDPSDLSAFAEYPIIAIVVGLVIWMMKFFRDERKELNDGFAAMNDKHVKSLDKNSDAITQLTITNRDVKTVVKELRDDIKRDNHGN